MPKKKQTLGAILFKEFANGRIWEHKFSEISRKVAKLRGGAGFVSFDNTSSRESYLRIWSEKKDAEMFTAIGVLCVHAIEGRGATLEMGSLTLPYQNDLALAVFEVQLRVIELTLGWRKKSNEPV